MRTLILGLIATIFLPAHAFAETCNIDIQARFIEGAPRDRFVIANKSTAAVISGVSLDLAPSAGRLTFDTESGGSGVEVFQLYRAESISARCSKRQMFKTAMTLLVSNV